MDKRFYLIIIGLVLFVSFLFSARKGKYDEFHKAKINGKIDTLYRYREYVMLFVGSEEYRIIPVSLSTNTPLDKLAAKGDYVNKNANSDTLSLTHEGDEVFYFTVKKGTFF